MARKALPIGKNLRIFAGSGNPALATSIAQELGVPMGKMLLTRFADGEIRVQVDESARGMDVFLIQPTCMPVNDNMMELLILLDAFRRASAQRITVVLPYYGYARQDKKIKPREPVTARLVADLISESGANRVVCVDLHAKQIQGFFRLPVDHLYAGPILGAHFKEIGLVNGDTCVVSPDEGGVTRARTLAETLQAPLAIISKRRPSPNKVEITEIIGDVFGKNCIIIDDMIDTGGSIVGGAQALIARGAASVTACCTHGVLSEPAIDRISASPIERVVLTDTVPFRYYDHPAAAKFTVLSVAELLADAIRRIHCDDSVSELFEKQW
ncbi:ribose-phosphate pyrophosphokinase [Armatimonas sp.]|uniref:ribose-phosphate diphosphokinase n=1 Tax=Armatimonas sp. TaxID=1872638 RepID=UPI00286B19F7|nr:ribose-phosphate pyrophosphokinase [Armatimonas sp.]